MVLILFKKEGFIIFSIYLLDTSQLFQWDLNRKIKIFGKRNIDEVHFCHAGDEEALIVPVKQENNILIANIPNILLQGSADIWYYLVAEGKTLKEGFFSVNNREKPSEYIYEETEILNYAALEKRLQKIEEDLKNFNFEFKEMDPTVPAWAKEPNKPTYSADEVGAVSKDEFNALSENVGKLSEEIFYIEITSNGTANKTYDDIVQAYDKGKYIILKDINENEIYKLNKIGSSSVGFSYIQGNTIKNIVLIKSLNQWVKTTIDLNLFQKSEENTLKTTDKTVVGAINELSEEIADLKESENVGTDFGGVEITSGEPTKDTTVMTLNPNAEEVHLYTAEEIDAKIPTWRTIRDFTIENEEAVANDTESGITWTVDDSGNITSFVFETDSDGKPFSANKLRYAIYPSDMMSGKIFGGKKGYLTVSCNGYGSSIYNATAVAAGYRIQGNVESDMSGILRQIIYMGVDRNSYGNERPHLNFFNSAGRGYATPPITRLKIGCDTDIWFASGAKVLVQICEEE